MSRMTRSAAMKRASLLIVFCAIMAACGSAPAAPQVVEKLITSEPQTVIQTQVVEKQVVVTPTPAPAVAAEPFQLTFLNGCFPSSQAVTDLMLAAYGAQHPEV